MTNQARSASESPLWLIPPVALMGVAILVAALGGAMTQRSVRAGTTDPIPPQVDGDPYPYPPGWANVELLKQTDAEAHAKSVGCIGCHANSRDPHFKDTLRLGCTDCHGGDASACTKEAAHVPARYPQFWPGSANPSRSYALLNHESPEFIRFVNPGDLRIAHISCGTVGCHKPIVDQNRKSMMTHGCMLWGAALYNNGSIPNKRARYGEAYSMHGVPLRLQSNPPPTHEEAVRRGVVPYLDPLPRFEVSQPGNVLRIFERGGRFRPEIGIPEREEEPGRPRTRLSIRGLGTENRTDPTMLGLQKTRLLDPTLNFLGTNDHPGDYRSSGCTACHVIYANDRSPVHSGPYAKFGNRGTSFQQDPTIPANESGHPIEHRFRNGIPSSQCMVCHIHPGTTVMNSYLGYMWWDEETDGEFMYPPHEKKLTSEERMRAHMNNPDEASARGNWSEPEFLANLTDLNPHLKHTQFADFHGHGWAFRAVFKHDRQGQLLDHQGRPLQNVTAKERMAAIEVPAKLKEFYRCPNGKPAHPSTDLENFQKSRDGLPVHMLDIHMERGMHCVDCHFIQDMHGNNRLQMEVRAAIEIQCIDCHGTPTKKTNLQTSGPASYTSGKNGRNLAALRTPFGKPRFEWEGERLFQNSMVEKDMRWEVIQTADTIDPTNRLGHYNQKAHLAKTVRFDAAGKFAWGDIPGGDEKKCAHNNSTMSCIACHSSWNPSCYGCHLPQKANQKTPHLHWDGEVTRNQISYNFQTLRDDVYMLAKDGDVTGNRIGPSRSSCAIHVGSYNNNRDSIYIQQQTISAEGFSGVAFSTNVPHTVRGRGVHETKQCTDCHVAKDDSNNALMAQLLMQGTNSLNFIGRYCWVAGGEHGVYSAVVTERDEPQTVIGSTLHALAFPERFRKHVEHGLELEHLHEHPGRDVSDRLIHPFTKPEVLAVQARGEYLYAACGEAGLRVFDIAFIDNKAFSERVTTAPVSPVGQKFFVKTRYATSIAAPCTPAPDPTRQHFIENREGRIHPLYGYLYVTDKYEGLILVGAATTIDGDPLNNFLMRELTFNPNGLLCGAKAVTIVGTYAYVCCDAGLVVIDIDDPKKPKVTAVLGEHEHIHKPRCVQVQFRYAFVCDEHGIQVLDVTDLAHPHHAGHLDLEGAKSIYLARTYAYVAAGKHGLVILDIEHPTHPRVDQVFTAGGEICDLHDVKLGITYVSQFAYLADGKNGIKIVQLTSPDTPGNDGFSPRPTPRLVARVKLPFGGHALQVSKGLDRDRAVDESGNQIGVFGRVGARPLNKEEQRRMYLHNGKVWHVSDDPTDPMYGLPRK